MRATRRVTVVVGCALVLAWGGSATAIDPFGARYLDDTDELLWFLQISDSHVGENLVYGTQDTDNLAAVLGTAVDTIVPEFVVLTGDLVDATNGWLIPTGQYQDEWDEYRDVLTAHAMDITFLHDVAGNHDTYSDPGASYYLANSLTGDAFGAWHEVWTHGYPWGEYLFVSLNTADTDGSPPGLDSEGLTADELDVFEQALIDHAGARLAFLFTHHPLSYFDYGDAEVLDLLDTHQVSLWANGHTHAHSEDFVDATLHLNLDSLGKASGQNLALYALDHDGLAARVTDIGAWPLVVVTAPTDTALGGTNPYAYPVSALQVANPVRALVFDPDGVYSVEFVVDGGSPQPMAEVAPSVWQGAWDCSGLSSGLHELTVFAIGPSGSDGHTIEVEVAVTACDDGQDNDGDGWVDHPDDPDCWGPSDDLEEGIAGDDDDDTTGDDDDTTGDDDDTTGDDDDDMTGDDDDTSGDDDDDTSGDDDDDTSGDDDDTSGDDDDSVGDDDTAVGDDDSAAVLDGGCVCRASGARGAGGVGGGVLVALAIGRGLSRRRRTAS